MTYQISNTRAAHIVIDRAAMSHNLNRVRELTPNAKIMAVIKADGYGHSMVVAAAALASADEFAVTGLDDVERLRTSGVSKPITMLSANFCLGDLNQMSANLVRPVIYDYEQLSLLSEISSSAALDLWLKLDTGMGRLGFAAQDLPAIVEKLSNCAGINSISLMTHLANVDNPHHPSNQAQISAFLEIAKTDSFDELSILNSAGVVAFSDQAQDVVRPGVMLYGVSPQAGKSAENLGLKPAMTFKSALISVKQLAAGSPIGYGSRYTLDSDTRIGVVACGYADGFPRHAPSGTLVLVNGMFVPIIGRVSMDLITVELGEMQAAVGDPVTLWGPDNPVESIAEAAGTIAYELLCSITQRVERIII